MICLHHTDLDGQCAAAVLRYFFKGLRLKRTKELINFYPVDYHRPWPFDKLKDQIVYLLDFGFNNLEDLWKIQAMAKRFIWIDHHKSNIEKLGGQSDSDWLLDSSKSGCELTWEYFFKSDPPYAVQLVGDYDTWKFKFGDKTRGFHEGLTLHDTEPFSSLWKSLFESETVVENIITKGRTCLHYRDEKNKAYMSSWGFETGFEGYKCLALNNGNRNSHLFGEGAIKKYDILIAFVFDGKQWTVSLYSDTVDVSKVAVEHGGGGHKGAAGFQCDELPFKKEEW